MNLNNRRHLLSEGSMHVWYRYLAAFFSRLSSYLSWRRGPHHPIGSALTPPFTPLLQYLIQTDRAHDTPYDDDEDCFRCVRSGHGGLHRGFRCAVRGTRRTCALELSRHISGIHDGGARDAVDGVCGRPQGRRRTGAQLEEL